MPKSVINLKFNTNKQKNSLYRFESKLNLSNVDFRNEEKLRANLTKEIEDIKRKYDEAIEKQEEKMKYELQQIDKLSVEKKLAHENEKQKVRLLFVRII